MSVITISRGSFSGGKTLAECLARRLGYRCIDRDVIVERAASFGVSQHELKDVLDKPPDFLERFQHKRYLYLVLSQAALAQEVRTGKAIYHGLAGHLLLRGGQPILRTRIIAPMEFRVQIVRARLKFSQQEALAYIEEVDEARRRWTQFLYGVDWGDPALYDIVINLEHIGIEDACRIISSMVLERRFELTPEGLQKMADLALASRVRADLAVNPPTSDLEVEVEAHGGEVSIQGSLTNIDRLAEVARIAKAVPGVTSLDLQKLSPPC